MAEFSTKNFSKRFRFVCQVVASHNNYDNKMMREALSSPSDVSQLLIQLHNFSDEEAEMWGIILRNAIIPLSIWTNNYQKE